MEKKTTKIVARCYFIFKALSPGDGVGWTGEKIYYILVVSLLYLQIKKRHVYGVSFVIYTYIDIYIFLIIRTEIVALATRNTGGF